MKKIYSLLFLMVAIAGFTSCTSEVDSVFSKSSAERMTETLANSKSVLESAPNGWLMQYYAGGSYGGYNVLCKFEGDSVKVTSELASEPVVSHFKLEQSQGAVLSFDSYNEVFHLFSDPVNELGIGTSGTGLGGDFEFRILSAEKDKVVLLGKKHGKTIVMTPFNGNWDTDWTNYVDAVDSVETAMAYKNYSIVVGEDTINAEHSYRSITYQDPDTKESVTRLYVVTDKGFKFTTPFEIKGKTINGFNYSTDDVWVADGESSVCLLPVIPPLSEQFKNATWYFSTDMSSNVAAYFNYAINGEKAIGEAIYYMYFGTRSDYGTWGLTFGSYDGSGLYGGCLICNMIANSATNVTLKFSLSGKGDGVWYYNNANFNYIVSALGTSTGKTWNLSTDDEKNPSWIKFTRSDNANYWFTLTSTPTYWPFGQLEK